MVFEVSMDFRNALFFLSYLFGENSTSLIVAMPVAHQCSPLCARRNRATESYLNSIVSDPFSQAARLLEDEGDFGRRKGLLRSALALSAAIRSAR